MPTDLRVGCCGFPGGLARYAQAFSVVEAQQTFYQPPRPKTLQNWRAQVPREFEFTLKAGQLITHEASSPTYRRLREKLNGPWKREAGAFRVNATVMNAWRRTLACAQALGSRMVLFQCPASFGPTPEHKANLRTFLREIRGELASLRLGEAFTFVWEPRGGWKTEEVQGLCQELGLVHGLDPFQQEPMGAGEGYFRLHGRTGYRYRYTDDDLNRLLEKAQGFVSCYVLFHNHSMLDDARRLCALAARGQRGVNGYGLPRLKPE